MLACLVECLRLPSVGVELMSGVADEMGLSLLNIDNHLSSLSMMNCVVWFAANDVCGNEGSTLMLLMHASSSGSLVVLLGFGFHAFGLPLDENPWWCCP